MVEVAHESAVCEDGHENKPYFRLGNDSIGYKCGQDTWENSLEVLIPQLIIFVVLHHDITHQLRPRDEVVEDGENGEGNIEQVHYIHGILLVQKGVVSPQHQPVRGDHRPDQWLVLENVSFYDDGRELDRSHAFSWNKLLQRFVGRGNRSCIPGRWVARNAHRQVADPENVGVDCEVRQENMLREYFEDARWAKLLLKLGAAVANYVRREFRQLAKKLLYTWPTQVHYQTWVNR